MEKILVCDVNLFSHGQYVYEIDYEGNKIGEVGIFTIDALGENMASYCQMHKIKKVILFGNKDYLNHSVVPDINRYAFKHFKNFSIDVEVKDK